jgi:hypothetical protein
LRGPWLAGACCWRGVAPATSRLLVACVGGPWRPGSLLDSRPLAGAWCDTLVDNQSLVDAAATATRTSCCDKGMERYLSIPLCEEPLKTPHARFAHIVNRAASMRGGRICERPLARGRAARVGSGASGLGPGQTSACRHIREPERHLHQLCASS